MTGSERAVQHHAVGLSVEALASAWARRDNVPGGSVVIVDSEIAGRRRLGEPWSGDSGGSLAFGMILRPDIELSHTNLLWLVGALAANESAAACSNVEVAIHWPDTVQLAYSKVPVGFVNVVSQLGPGRVEHAVVSLRFSLSGLGLSGTDGAELLDRAVLELDSASSLLADDRQHLIDAVTERTSAIGRRVKAALLPRGEARGRATAIDPQGQLVLETPTGMLENVAVDGLRDIKYV